MVAYDQDFYDTTALIESKIPRTESLDRLADQIYQFFTDILSLPDPSIFLADSLDLPNHLPNSFLFSLSYQIYLSQKVIILVKVGVYLHGFETAGYYLFHGVFFVETVGKVVIDIVVLVLVLGESLLSVVVDGFV